MLVHFTIQISRGILHFISHILLLNVNIQNMVALKLSISDFSIAFLNHHL